jgi:hypothetical protein
MTNETILLLENSQLFSPISQVNYSYYSSLDQLSEDLGKDENIQVIAGLNGNNFGESQKPGLFSYADGIDTMQFLLAL